MDVTFEQILNFILIHNESIIQWLVIVVLGLTLGVVGISIFGRHPGTDEDNQTARSPGALAAPANVATNNLGIASAAGAVAGVMPAEAAAAVAQVTHLQAELNLRTQELVQLKADAQKNKGESVDISEYLKKIKDLEGKLSEYEILEDDIADLYLYKEENSKLKAEVQRLSTGVPLGAAASAPAAPAQAPAPEDSQVAEDPLAGVFQAAPAAPVVELSEPAPIVEEEEEKDLMEQFASAVELTKPPAPQVAVAVAPPPKEGEEVPGDDLLTEFAASIAEPGDEADNDLDTDKMLAEMADLDDKPITDSSTLEEEADIDKMAAEATKLLGNE